VAIGRPKSDDAPRKYRESYRLYQFSEPTQGHDLTAIEELTAYLEWAIAQKKPGFHEGDIINVSSLAKGVNKSRNTAGKSVETLVNKGMLVQGKPKSPYQIVSRTPIFKDTGVVADEQISLTMKFDSVSHISRVGTCELGTADSHGNVTTISGLLRHELNTSHDMLVHEAADEYWRRGQYQYYLRLRTTDVVGRPTAALLEITYLHLPVESVELFSEGVASLRENQVTQISLYPLLEQCGLSGFRSGRSHATVAPTPPLLLAELSNSIDFKDIDMSAFENEQPLLKWTYGIFHPEANPMITFSV